MKKISIILCLLLAVIISNTSLSAYAVDYPKINEYLPQTTDHAPTNLRAPNGVPISSTPRVDGTGIDVYVGNIGVDGLDMVTITITATGYTKPQIKKGYVPALLGKTFKFNIPFIACNTKYNIKIDIFDGGQTKTLFRSAELNYTDEILAAANWHKGTFSSRQKSLEYHFKVHALDEGVCAENLVEYLNIATSYYEVVIDALANNNVNDYTITSGTGPIKSHKYKNKPFGLFIIITDSDMQILSFGGK